MVGAHAAEYMEDIFVRLEYIQATTSLIDPECDVQSECGAQRSGRCFLTTQATNKGQTSRGEVCEQINDSFILK